MKPREGTWGEVAVGVVIQPPDLKHYLVVAEAVASDGARWVQLMNSHRQRVSTPRQPDAAPVTIMETSEPEAILLLGEEMGAAVLRASNDTTLPLRAMRFRVDPLPTKGRGVSEAVKSHIDMTHGVYVGDGSTNRTPKQWHEIHDEMHAAETATMVIPHHHEEER